MFRAKNFISLIYFFIFISFKGFWNAGHFKATDKRFELSFIALYFIVPPTIFSFRLEFPSLSQKVSQKFLKIEIFAKFALNCIFLKDNENRD